MDGSERVLTVTHYGEDDDETRFVKRVTIAPHMVHFVISSEEDNGMVPGQDIRKINVVLSEGHNLELNVSLLDLMSIERAIGTYMLP